MGMTLIKIRQMFHPLHAKHLVLMVIAITAHMLLQMWLYHTGRFNLYLMMMCLGQFTNKLYKRWGKAFVMAVQEADRSRRTRLAFIHSFTTAATATATTTATTPASAPASLSQNASSGRSRRSSSSFSSYIHPSPASSFSSTTAAAVVNGGGGGIAIDNSSAHSTATLPMSSRLDGATQHPTPTPTPAFAPPGTTPASGSPHVARPASRKSSFFDFSSPTKNRRMSAAAATATAAAAASRRNTAIGGGDGGSSHAPWGSEGGGGGRGGSPPGGRRGTAPYLGTPFLATVAASDS
ncbi:unnamed protein product, partial [Laminaria digitata]